MRIENQILFLPVCGVLLCISAKILWKSVLVRWYYRFRLRFKKTIVEQVRFVEKKLFANPKTILKVWLPIFAEIPTFKELTHRGFNDCLFLLYSNTLQLSKERYYFETIKFEALLEERMQHLLFREFEEALKMGDETTIFECSGKILYFATIQCGSEKEETQELLCYLERRLAVYGISIPEDDLTYIWGTYFEGMKFFNARQEYENVWVGTFLSENFLLRKYRSKYLNP